jgi:hypothetical protein
MGQKKLEGTAAHMHCRSAEQVAWENNGNCTGGMSIVVYAMLLAFAASQQDAARPGVQMGALRWRPSGGMDEQDAASIDLSRGP